MRARARGSRKIRRRSKTIPLKGHSVRGNGEDAGKWFKCWNCGFICNVDRDALGDNETRSGDGQTDYHTPSYGSSDMSDEVNGLAALEDYTVALALGVDGNPQGIRHNIMSDVSSGCPMCGSRNWRGDY